MTRRRYLYSYVLLEGCHSTNVCMFEYDYLIRAHLILTWPGAATYRQLRAPQKTWQRCCRQLEHMTTVHQIWYYILRWSKLVQEKCHKTIKCHLSTTLSQCEFCQSCMMAGVSRWSAGKGDAVLLWGRGGENDRGHNTRITQELSLVPPGEIATATM